MTSWAKGTLVEGRVEVGTKIRFKLKSEPKDANANGGVICETQRVGKEHPRAIVKLNRDGSLVAVEFENVSPGALIKSPGT
ncbi:MAG: hypothetical protein QOF36_2630 [Microbacteriaceae bacterium]|jgi:hypothetical protein|nr:hypothetical protein [Microbacteriaceae bacterium]